MKKGITPIVLAMMIILLVGGLLILMMIVNASFKEWARGSCFFMANKLTPFGILDYLGITGRLCELLFGW